MARIGQNERQNTSSRQLRSVGDAEVIGLEKNGHGSLLEGETQSEEKIT